MFQALAVDGGEDVGEESLSLLRRHERGDLLEVFRRCGLAVGAQRALGNDLCGQIRGWWTAAASAPEQGSVGRVDLAAHVFAAAEIVAMERVDALKGGIVELVFIAQPQQASLLRWELAWAHAFTGDPQRDAGRGGGMAVSIGPVQRCEVMTVKFFALAHNAIRGAAGGAIANAELLYARGLLPTG